MTFGELSKRLYEVLSEAGVEDARFDSSLIAEEFFPDTGLETELDPNLARQCLLAADTVASGAPVQYVLGSAYFWREKYEVSVGVLIPRSDSETLVECALKFCGALDIPQDVYAGITSADLKTAEFADLCCGTGCIGISVANELVSHGISTNVHLADLSDEALIFANKNTSLCKASVDVTKLDVMEEGLPWEGLDFITANPPYVTGAEYEALEDKIRLYEPEMALLAKDDGLAFYAPLARIALKSVRSGGMLMAEHGFAQGETVRQIFSDSGLLDVITIRDIAGRDRVTCGRVG